MQWNSEAKARKKAKARNCNDFEPSHAKLLHVFDSTAAPRSPALQSLPPNLGEGLSHKRDLVVMPPPQVELHSTQGLQPLKAPFTREMKKFVEFARTVKITNCQLLVKSQTCFHSYSPGHGELLHSRDSSAAPIWRQSRPPKAGGGREHFLNLSCTPPPHDARHLLHADHSVYPPSNASESDTMQLNERRNYSVGVLTLCTEHRI